MLSAAALRRRTLVRWGIVGFGLLAWLSAARGTCPIPKRRPLLLDGAAIPAFSLTDQRNRPFTHAQLAGSVWVADFIFTTCPGQCLLMSDRMASVQRAFADEPRLRFVSFSVDPEHDTPEALAAYATRHGGDPRWALLTGERAAIDALSRNGFHLAAAPGDATARDPIVHSMRLVLVDARGRIRGYYDASNASQMGELPRAIRALLDGA